MGKSIEGSYINLTDDLDAIRKKVRSIPTATTAGGEMSGGVKTLFTFADLFIPQTVDGFKKQYEDGSLKFVEIKDAIADAIFTDLRPLQERRRELERDTVCVNKVISEGAEKARTLARKTVDEVKQKMGLF